MSKNAPISARKIVGKTFLDTAHCYVDDISWNSRIFHVILLNLQNSTTGAHSWKIKR